MSGAAKIRAKGAVISPKTLAKVLAEGGKLARTDQLRMKIKYLTDGAVLGSKAFVAEQLAEHRRRTGRGQRTEPQAVPNFADLAIMRKLRLPALG